MEKALEILNQQLRDETLWLNSHEEAIKELEEAMKPKTCEGCKYSFYWECADVLECTKLDKQHCCNCEEDLNMTEVVGDFCCNRYEAKDTQC